MNTYNHQISMFKSLSVIALAMGLAGCFGTNSQSGSNTSVEKTPDWVTSPPKSNTYLYGVGSASRIENLALAFTQAEQNGNAQIAQQLRTQVSQVNTQDIQVNSSGSGTEDVRKTQTAYTRVSTAPIELEQAVNEQRFAGEQYVYALQSVDRSRIESRLQQKIIEQDTLIRQQANRLNPGIQTQDWSNYMGLIPLFAQRTSYQSELNLYSTSHTIQGQAPADIRDIEVQLNDALLSFGFDVSNSEQSSALASALSSFGFTPKANGVFQLHSKTQQHSEIQNGRYYVFEEGTLDLTGPTGEHLASWTVSARGIGKNQLRATEQASTAWSTQAVEAMFLWLTRLD